MEVGEKLRQARLELGLSQKALCGEYITRNMLSQIENGSARPSMKTLRYLSSRLGKPLAFFLEEELGETPNQRRIFAARQAFDAGDWAAAVEVLGEFQQPDEIFGREYVWMWQVSHLNLAQAAIAGRRYPYARELLEKSGAEETDRTYLLLLGALGAQVSSRLPSLDEELLLRAGEALAQGNPDRADGLLGAVEDHSSRWYLMKGQVSFARKDYRRAVEELQLAEGTYPKETVPQLEAAFRELGDFEKAYFYACKGRDQGERLSATS